MSEKCNRCKKNNGKELHSCPYKSDIDDNDKELCNCCEDCEEECAMDI